MLWSWPDGVVSDPEKNFNNPLDKVVETVKLMLVR